jgi:hypothetical protein
MSFATFAQHAVTSLGSSFGAGRVLGMELVSSPKPPDKRCDPSGFPALESPASRLASGIGVGELLNRTQEVARSSLAGQLRLGARAPRQHLANTPAHMADELRHAPRPSISVICREDLPAICRGYPRFATRCPTENRGVPVRVRGLAI